jgi:hypothetical protein
MQPQVGSSLAPQHPTTLPTNAFRDELIRMLQVPAHLTDRSDATLQVAYARLKAHAQAQLTLSEMVTAGTWRGPKPAAAQLAELFISKSAWFQFYCKAFRKISNFPDMILWLEDAPEAGTSMDVWGFQKNRYGFTDLIEYIARGGPLEDDGEYEEEVVVKKSDKHKRKAKEEKGSEKKKEKKATRTRRSS